MQVAGIVRPVTSAGPDDKLLHIENFGTNEGTKFEYRFSRFSFSRSSLLFPPFLSFFFRSPSRVFAFLSCLLRAVIPLAYLRSRRHNDFLIWFIERFLFYARTCIYQATFFLPLEACIQRDETFLRRKWDKLTKLQGHVCFVLNYIRYRQKCLNWLKSSWVL